MVLILSGLAFQPAVAVAASALVAGAAEMTAAEKETLELVRPGGAGRAYWNQHATWFMYRPKLCFPSLSGATNYSYAVVDDHHVSRVYEGRDSETAIPSEAHYAQMVRDMLAWYEADPKDWRGTWRKAADKYGCAACRREG